MNFFTTEENRQSLINKVSSELTNSERCQLVSEVMIASTQADDYDWEDYDEMDIEIQCILQSQGSPQITDISSFSTSHSSASNNQTELSIEDYQSYMMTT